MNRPIPRRCATLAVAMLACACACLGATGPCAFAASVAPSSSAGASAPAEHENANALEAAASKAGEVGRKVAMSLIALAFSIAAILLAFRRDFKEAVGVFVIGLVAVLLATPVGVSLVRDTVSSLFGSA